MIDPATILIGSQGRERSVTLHPDQVAGLVDILAFLAADPTHRVSGYVVGWRAIPKEGANP